MRTVGLIMTSRRSRRSTCASAGEFDLSHDAVDASALNRPVEMEIVTLTMAQRQLFNDSLVQNSRAETCLHRRRQRAAVCAYLDERNRQENDRVAYRFSRADDVETGAA